VATLDSEFPSKPYDDDDGDAEPLTLPAKRRLPMLTAVLAVALLVAGAFIVGAEVQKHWGASSSGSSAGGASSFASRFGGAGRTGTTTTGSAGTRAGALAGGGATIGTVSVIKGGTLYVTDTSGNTVKVVVPVGTSVSKTVTTNVKGIRPGQTVVVRGTAGKNGNVTAQSITVGSTGAGGLFGGFGGGGRGSGGFGSGSGGASGFGGGSSTGGATGFGGGSSGGGG